jgi:hypothetical protein
MITALTINVIKIVYETKMLTPILKEFFKLKTMIYISFFINLAIPFKNFDVDKKLVGLYENFFGTFCAYLDFPNIKKNNILNLTVSSS